MTDTARVAPTQAAAAPYRWRWVALVVVLAAEVMDLIDALVTTVAAPAIRADLGGTATMVQWLGAAYPLAMAVGLLTGGRLGDLYGRRRVFLIGAVGFTASSMLCALAQSPETLIGARALQGLFAAVMIPQGLGFIKEMFPPKEMASAFGLFGPVIGLTMVGGPILAGWLVEADVFGTGWRMIFLVNLVPGLLVVVAGRRFLPASPPAAALKLDLVGVVLAATAALLIMLPLVQGRELGWPAWTFASMAASVAAFGLFGRYEAWRQRRGGDPLIVASLFRQRAFIGGLIAGVVFFASMTGFSLVFTLYVQLGLGFSPLGAGLAAAPQAVGMVLGVGLINGGGLARRFGRLMVQAGTLAMFAGVLAFLLTLRLAGPDPSAWEMAPALIVIGLGTGLLLAPFFDIVLAGVTPAETGSASGALTAVQQLGGALGIAALGTLFFALLGGESAGRPAFADAMSGTLLLELGLLAVTFAASFTLPRHADPHP